MKEETTHVRIKVSDLARLDKLKRELSLAEGRDLSRDDVITLLLDDYETKKRSS